MSNIQPSIHASGGVGDEELIRNFTTAKTEIAALQTATATAKISNITANPITVDDIKQGRYYDFEWNPLTPLPGDATTTVAADFIRLTINSQAGNMGGFSHGVGRFTYIDLTGGAIIGQCFANEVRIATHSSTTTGTLVIDKTVLEPNASVSGTISTLCLRQFSDSSATSTWVTQVVTDDFLDPRCISKTSGGHLVRSGSIGVSTKTMVETDSGKSFIGLAGVAIDITVPADLTPGWKCRFVQGDANKIRILAGAGGVLLNKDSHTRTASTYAVIDVEMIAPGFIVLSGFTSA